MTESYSFYFNDGRRFLQHPIFTFVVDDLVYIQRFDIEFGYMQRQWEGQPLEGKSLEEHAKAYTDRITPVPTDIVSKTIPLHPGKYYPRIHKPGLKEANFPENHFNVIDRKVLGQSLITANIILKKLSSIFETVSPDVANETVYGHELRNLLLLSAMEVESAWSAILRANNYQFNTKQNGDINSSTNDYVKLCKPLHLDKYKVSFVLHSDLQDIKPFENWIDSNPTTSLNWYNAYNKVKHDREQNLILASLKNAINSVAGVLVMLRAQFGEEQTFWSQGEFANIFIELDKAYNLEDYYVPFSNDKHIPCNWSAINYEF